MNQLKIVKELEQQYPGKRIFKNNELSPSEILCEIEPTNDHPDYSVAIAVIDHSIPHFHKYIKEIYEIIKGNLELHVEDQIIKLKPGDTYTIKPRTTHFALGHETWVRTTAHPGWTQSDHHIE